LNALISGWYNLCNFINEAKAVRHEKFGVASNIRLALSCTGWSSSVQIVSSSHQIRYYSDGSGMLFHGVMETVNLPICKVVDVFRYQAIQFTQFHKNHNRN